MLEAGLPFGAEMKQSTIEKTKLKEILEKLHPPSQKLWAKQFSHLGFSHLESVVALRFGDILNDIHGILSWLRNTAYDIILKINMASSGIRTHNLHICNPTPLPLILNDIRYMIFEVG